jgi:hypothetical protein
MSPPFLTAASTMMCPHGGTVMATPSCTQAVIDAPILTVSDTFTIVGCPFPVPGSAPPVPSPCVSVQWSSPSTKVTHGGAPALTSASVGLCLAATQAPQGNVVVASTQPSAEGT